MSSTVFAGRHGQVVVDRAREVLGVSLIGAALSMTDLQGKFSWHPICMTSATMVRAGKSSAFGQG